MVYDLIIIGGGSAGATAGIYAARKKLKTLLITKDFFGQITKTRQVDNWPGDMAISGMVLMQKLEKHLKSFDIEIKSGQKVISVEKQEELAGQVPLALAGTCRASSSELSLAKFRVEVEGGEKYEARAIIVATGRKERQLGILGEEKFVGRGISYCSICDAPFFKDKTAVVVGVGNSALSSALDLSRYAKEVFVLANNENIIADEMLLLHSKEAGNIKFEMNKKVIEIKGDKMVEAVLYEDIKTKEAKEIKTSGVFINIGSLPVSDFMGDLAEKNEAGEIVVNAKDMASSMPGIFAAGDCNNIKYKQMIIAAGDGAKAALSAYEYLQNL